MSTRTDEDMIRQALERQAGLAVPADRIRAALPALAARRARQRRVRTAVVAVAAAVAVGATVAVPVLGLGRAAAPITPAAPPNPTATTAAPAAMPLRYRPTWLPPGFTERSRMVSSTADGAVIQIWTREPKGVQLYSGGPRLEFSVTPAPGGVDPYGTSGTRVDVNGRPGYLVGTPGDGNKSYLHWMVDGSTVLQVHLVDYRVSRADLEKAARSVRPTPAVQAAPLRAGWLPAGLVARPGVGIDGDSARFWQARVYAEAPTRAAQVDPSTAAEKVDPSGQDPLSVVLTVGTETAAPSGGESTTVGGRPARFVTHMPEPGRPRKHSYVVVDLGGGLQLTVLATNPPVSRAALTRIAEQAEVDPSPDVAWLGTA